MVTPMTRPGSEVLREWLQVLRQMRDGLADVLFSGELYALDARIAETETALEAQRRREKAAG